MIRVVRAETAQLRGQMEDEISLKEEELALVQEEHRQREEELERLRNRGNDTQNFLLSDHVVCCSTCCIHKIAVRCSCVIAI